MPLGSHAVVIQVLYPMVPADEVLRESERANCIVNDSLFLFFGRWMADILHTGVENWRWQ